VSQSALDHIQAFLRYNVLVRYVGPLPAHQRPQQSDPGEIKPEYPECRPPVAVRQVEDHRRQHQSATHDQAEKHI